jgi:xylulokinase
MEFGDASGTALMDVRTRSWCRPVCDAIDEDLPGKLPPLASSLEPVGTLLPAWAEEWRLPARVVVSAGGGDNMMAAIGTGNIKPGMVTASLGTSGTIFACCDKPVIDPQGEIAAFCDSADHWMPLLCTMNVTVATEVFRNLFGWDHARMDAEISGVPPGAEGLLFLPYLQGERTPNLPHGCGVLHGMTTTNLTPAHLARAAMEGVTLGMAYGLRRMESLGLEPTEIRVTGGGSQSPVWRQILADVFGYPVVTMQNAEGAALGAAIQALHAAAPGASLEELATRCSPVQSGSRLEPRQAGFYSGHLDRQNILRETTQQARCLPR